MDRCVCVCVGGRGVQRSVYVTTGTLRYIRVGFGLWLCTEISHRFDLYAKYLNFIASLHMDRARAHVLAQA